MPVTFNPGSALISVSPLDLITSACMEGNLVGEGEPITAAKSAWGLEKLQRLIDQFNAREELIYNESFARFTLIPNHAPHTIGPGGDFNLVSRPVKLVSATLILNRGTNAEVDVPMGVREDAWWAKVPIKNLSSTLPNDVYYSPDIPLGSCYFLPVPTVVNDVRLGIWGSITQALDLTTPLFMPPGYWEALVTTLALSLCPAFDKTPSQVLVALQREAMMAIKNNNGSTDRIHTNGAGMPGSEGGHYNFLTGLIE